MEHEMIRYADCILNILHCVGESNSLYGSWMTEKSLPGAQRNYKDTVFRMLFGEAPALLGLFNAVNKTSFTNVEDLEITTLENAVYLGMKNDVSCVFDFQLSLFEHQSTINPNMPLRDLFYVVRQLQKLISEERLYRSKAVKIPTPRFVVFYNGSDPLPEYFERRLSASKGICAVYGEDS